jgi:hypothetical protein
MVNEKPDPIVLEFHQRRERDAFKIVGASQRSVALKGDEVWTFRLRPGERAQLRYAFSYRD